MRKLFVIAITMILVPAFAFSADFEPTVLTLTAPAEIEYQFDGNDLSIPLTVAGTPAAMWLVVNTHGKGQDIGEVENGYLGWHYVNKIDTTVYVSQKYNRVPGESTIVWDGTDQDGNAVAAGTYDYYLWAYDDQTPRQWVCDYIAIGWDWDSQPCHIYEVGEDGLPLANPLIVGSMSRSQATKNDADEPWKSHGVHFKWIIGSDPFDLTKMQTTDCALYQSRSVETEPGFLDHGVQVFNPNDYSIFYHCCRDVDALTNTMFKWQFVTDGEAIRDEDWLGWDELTWKDLGAVHGPASQKPACYTDRSYIYVVSPAMHQYEVQWTKLRCVSFDGEVIFDKMMDDWYFPDDPNPSGYINGSFHNMYSRGNNEWILSSHMCCIQQFIDTSRILEDADDETDMVLWQNGNGDYWMDVAWTPDMEPAWFCLFDPKGLSNRRNGVALDSNKFTVLSVSRRAMINFGVATQDGTAIGYMGFADTLPENNELNKGGGILCDSGSQYDGLYHNHERIMEGTSVKVSQYSKTMYVAFDSVAGIITNEPSGIAVEEEVQGAFAVDQNSPNPFNPTTSISFTIPEGNHVMVEIYNVSGQKVDTLVNDFLDAGKHSVVWDASGLSNGVYFYTVKSGDFSKTMKMTLLK